MGTLKKVMDINLIITPTRKSEDYLKKYEGQWSKIRYLYRSITNSKFNNSDNYNE